MEGWESSVHPLEKGFGVSIDRGGGRIRRNDSLLKKYDGIITFNVSLKYDEYHYT